MRKGFTLGQYLMLVDYTSRLVRDGSQTARRQIQLKNLATGADCPLSRVIASPAQRRQSTSAAGQAKTRYPSRL